MILFQPCLNLFYPCHMAQRFQISQTLSEWFAVCKTLAHSSARLWQGFNHVSSSAEICGCQDAVGIENPGNKPLFSQHAR